MNTLLAAPAFQASQASTRTGFAGLAAVVTFSLLAGVAQIADHQVDAELMAQASPEPQVVVIVGHRSAPRA